MTTATTEPLTHEQAAELTKQIEFHEDTASWYYTGPLDDGKALIEQDWYTAVEHHPDGGVSVILSTAPDPDWESRDQWGSSAAGDLEQAWRYALGAEFGPPPEHDEDDDLFDPAE